MRPTSHGYKAHSVPGAGTSFSGKETSCCVQDKRRETGRLYAIAAVHAKRTQQPPRACPNDHAQTGFSPSPRLSRVRASAVIDTSSGFVENLESLKVI